MPERVDGFLGSRLRALVLQVARRAEKIGPGDRGIRVYKPIRVV